MNMIWLSHLSQLNEYDLVGSFNLVKEYDMVESFKLVK